MTDPGLLRFLELAARELSAVDARVELGGRDPDDPRLVFQTTSNGRVVVVFDAPPPDRAAVEQRLEALVSTLFGAAIEHSPSSARTPPDVAGQRLDDELGRLSDRAGASGALVFDLASPVIWGASRSGNVDRERLYQSVIDCVREAQSELRQHHTARLRVSEGIECLARHFAGLYVVALAFEGDIS
ncbi:MAG TPA: hypothetical protein VHU80_04765, partial [Polyangiaceae bacterium]|nr:hypothetical protein [Polyangiaceae bacterium]